jgi:hypothetical protein
VYGANITLSELGEGSSVKFNGSPAFQLKFGIDIHLSGLKGTSSIARQVVSSAGEQPFNEYCGIRN